jgi:hypothetical protein
MKTNEVIKLAIEAGETGRPGACTEILKALLDGMEAGFVGVSEFFMSDLLGEGETFIKNAQVAAFHIEGNKKSESDNSPSAA